MLWDTKIWTPLLGAREHDLADTYLVSSGSSSPSFPSVLVSPLLEVLDVLVGLLRGAGSALSVSDFSVLSAWTSMA